MIHIKNLTKVYYTSRKDTCRGIENLNITLPDKGMVFVVGKSGSGKSTLLNLIGGVDNVTSGDILIGDKNIARFNTTQLQEYRSSYLGFIFQNFLLLEELTVLENIELALNISGIKDEGALTDIIQRAQLSGLEHKFPNELSGGQRQRVGVARALIKNPKLLLCDEPTGNLDYRTSAQILDILKKESEQKLVLIVSHNLKEAEDYADRIIELHDGKVISDQTKDHTHDDGLTVIGDTVVLPHGKNLDESQIALLNDKIRSGDVEFEQNKGSFSDTDELEFRVSETKLRSSHLSYKNSLKLSALFARKNRRGAAYTVIITALYICLFYLLQALVFFDANNSLKRVDNEALTVINVSHEAATGSLTFSSLQEIDEEQIDSFFAKGYEGNIYKLYNYNISWQSSYIKQGWGDKLSNALYYNALMETLGTLCCDEQYLTGVFGEIVVLAGSLDGATNKLIITDYVADFLMGSSGQTDYQQCLERYSDKVAAIIYTGYREKYAKLYENEQKAKEKGEESQKYVIRCQKDPLFVEFATEVVEKLGITYTFATDFYKDVRYPDHESLTLADAALIKGGEVFDITYGMSIGQSSELTGNQIKMSIVDYNMIFKTFYTEAAITGFEPKKVTLIKYNNSTTKEITDELEIEIVGIGSSTECSPELREKLYPVTTYAFGLAFDNLSQKSLIVDVASKNGFTLNGVDTYTVPVINSILNVFMGIFYLVGAMLFVVIFLHIVLYGMRIIKKNIYEVGVLKALGAKIMDIGIIFIVKLVLMGLAISALSVLGIFAFSAVANLLLTSAMENVIKSVFVNVKIFIAVPEIILGNLLLVMFTSIISSVIPLLYLKKVKPLVILRDEKKNRGG